MNKCVFVENIDDLKSLAEILNDYDAYEVINQHKDLKSLIKYIDEVNSLNANKKLTNFMKTFKKYNGIFCDLEPTLDGNIIYYVVPDNIDVNNVYSLKRKEL